LTVVEDWGGGRCIKGGEKILKKAKKQWLLPQKNRLEHDVRLATTDVLAASNSIAHPYPVKLGTTLIRQPQSELCIPYISPLFPV
jgi:hypothetical protein